MGFCTINTESPYKYQSFDYISSERREIERDEI